MSTAPMWYRGDTKRLIVNTIDPAGQPIPLAGALLSFAFVNKRTETIIFTKNLGDGVEITGTSQFTVHIAPEDTASLPPGDYICQARGFWASSEDKATLLDLTIRLVNVWAD